MVSIQDVKLCLYMKILNYQGYSVMMWIFFYCYRLEFGCVVDVSGKTLFSFSG
jgi:hypothetical protein